MELAANGWLQQNESANEDARKHAKKMREEENASVGRSVRVNESVHQDANVNGSRQENVRERYE